MDINIYRSTAVFSILNYNMIICLYIYIYNFNIYIYILFFWAGHLFDWAWIVKHCTMCSSCRRWSWLTVTQCVQLKPRRRPVQRLYCLWKSWESLWIFGWMNLPTNSLLFAVIRVIHLFWQSLMSEQQFETFYQVGCTQHFPQYIFQLAFHSPPTGLDFHINQRVLSVLNIVELLVS